MEVAAVEVVIGGIFGGGAGGGRGSWGKRCDWGGKRAGVALLALDARCNAIEPHLFNCFFYMLRSGHINLPQQPVRINGC